MAASTKSSDAGLQQYIRRIDRLDGHGVKVGVTGDAGQQDGVDLLDIAMFNEFGTETIPARPFIRDFAQKNAKALGALMDRTVSLVEKGKPLDVALASLGSVVQEQQQKHVRASKSWAVPNAKSTVRQKGSDVPLVDHGTLVNAIRWEKV